jgi:hypothetical protein
MAVRRITLAAALLAVLASLILVAAPARAAGTGSLSPQSVGPGGTITVNVTGFRPGERIDRWYTRPDSSSEALFPYVFADRDGAATWTLTLPGDAPAGLWTMAARGVRSNDRIGLGFTVTRDAPPVPVAPRTSVDPAAGAPGTRFAFSGTGFNWYEQVDVWLNGPQNQNLPGPFEVYADGQGIAYWAWTAPEDLPQGTWRMVAVGRKSRVQHIIPFEVR